MIMKKVGFKFRLKCRQCRWWRHFWRKTVFAAATKNARSLTVRRCVCGTARSVTTQNANVVDLEDWRHAVDCQSDIFVRDPSDTKTRVLPVWTIFALVHEANADGDVEVWSGHTYSHWTLVVLLHSSQSVTSVTSTSFLIRTNWFSGRAIHLLVGFRSCWSCGLNHLRKSTQRKPVVTET